MTYVDHDPNVYYMEEQNKKIIEEVEITKLQVDNIEPEEGYVYKTNSNDNKTYAKNLKLMVS